MSNLLALFDAVSLCFIAFVITDWYNLSPFSRLIILFMVLDVTYGLAILLRKLQMKGFCEVAFLAGVGVLGAGVILIQDIYPSHIDEALIGYGAWERWRRGFWANPK